MKYELEVIADISNGKKIIKKNDLIKKLFNLDTIELEEYIDSKTGKHIKKYSSIYQDNTHYKINKPYEELKNLIQNRTTPVLGFMSKSKNYKHGG